MEKPNISIRCIVRGFNDKPYMLYVDEFNETHVSVKPFDKSYDTPLCFENQYIYQYDSCVFDRLLGIYNSGNRDKLDDEWRKTRPWSPNENEKLVSSSR